MKGYVNPRLIPYRSLRSTVDSAQDLSSEVVGSNPTEDTRPRAEIRTFQQAVVFVVQPVFLLFNLFTYRRVNPRLIPYRTLRSAVESVQDLSSEVARSNPTEGSVLFLPILFRSVYRRVNIGTTLTETFVAQWVARRT